MAATGIEFPLVEADAGETGLPDASFDLALSEYGASIWVDARRWIPEAARLLRPGGRLIFLRNSTLAMLCAAEDERTATTLQRPQAGLHRVAWGDGAVEFQLPHGELIDVLHASGFELSVWSSSTPVRRPSTIRVTTTSPPTGRAAGPPRSCGRRASGERR